ncbi:DUF5658 family protein [Aquibacillus albus]|uniref:DUF5658 domain-containing protein n=1 Tax=Aquibacillus albus TaxID=1168171 RepID=A0ABS2N2L5_9BACI|nr:DUF5658 family protein [Aquibacillus albus]MBM7572398.1 hypothetical protein [Aquibacillus albus]
MFKTIIFYLAILNMLDGFITYYGLENAYISEANPLMESLYSYSPVLFIVLKIMLSIFLLALVIVFRVPATSLIKGLALSASFLYTFTFFIHSIWLFQL